MPKLGDLDAFQTPTGNFSFSATRIQDLGATEYTLVSLVVDESGSTDAFKPDMEKTIKEVVKACKFSPRADNLMLQLLAFDNRRREIHGFKLLENCNEADYDGCLTGNGLTALYDTAHFAVESVSTYGKQLLSNDYSVNGIVFVITDGDDNTSKFTVNSLNQALANAKKTECLESLLSILIGVNITDPKISQYLNDLHKNAGFTNYIEMNDASSKTLAKLAAFVSKSISSQSQSLGSGVAAPSQSLTF